MIKLCAFCGNDFHVYKCDFNRRKCCSKTCLNNIQIGKSSRVKQGDHVQCQTCGDSFYLPAYRIKQNGRFCSSSCYGVSLLNKKLSDTTKKKIAEKRKGFLLKGGVYKNGAGYVMFYYPEHPQANSKGYVRQHRLVMEQFLGRYLSKKEVVHHKNHIKNDNRIENLELFESHSDHMRIHKNRLKV
jgi:hypothetical protein